jgi:NO-binding membrane sensor protein with MHYT domain
MPPWESLPHDSLATNIIVAASVCWAIAAVFVALRFYTRVAIIKVVGASDWCILVALVRRDDMFSKG